MPSGVPLPGRIGIAIEQGDLGRIRRLAQEDETFDLWEALQITLLICAKEPRNYERAAKRWLARAALEAPAATVKDLVCLAEALADAVDHPREARERLVVTCRRCEIAQDHRR